MNHHNKKMKPWTHPTTKTKESVELSVTRLKVNTTESKEETVARVNENAKAWFQSIAQQKEHMILSRQHTTEHEKELAKQEEYINRFVFKREKEPENLGKAAYEKSKPPNPIENKVRPNIEPKVYDYKSYAKYQNHVVKCPNLTDMPHVLETHQSLFNSVKEQEVVEFGLTQVVEHPTGQLILFGWLTRENQTVALRVRNFYPYFFLGAPSTDLHFLDFLEPRLLDFLNDQLLIRDNHREKRPDLELVRSLERSWRQTIPVYDGLPPSLHWQIFFRDYAVLEKYRETLYFHKPLLQSFFRSSALEYYLTELLFRRPQGEEKNNPTVNLILSFCSDELNPEHAVHLVTEPPLSHEEFSQTQMFFQQTTLAYNQRIVVPKSCVQWLLPDSWKQYEILRAKHFESIDKFSEMNHLSSSTTKRAFVPPCPKHREDLHISPHQLNDIERSFKTSYQDLESEGYIRYTKAKLEGVINFDDIDKPSINMVAPCGPQGLGLVNNTSSNPFTHQSKPIIYGYQGKPIPFHLLVWDAEMTSEQIMAQCRKAKFKPPLMGFDAPSSSSSSSSQTHKTEEMTMESKEKESLKLNRMPNPGLSKDRIAMIVSHFLLNGQQTPYLKVAHVLGDYDFAIDELKDMLIYQWPYSAEGEMQLLLHWSKMIEHLDMEWITGYNSLKFDMPFVMRRAQVLKVYPVAEYLSRFLAWPHYRYDPSKYTSMYEKCNVYARNTIKKHNQNEEMIQVEIPGRIQFDVLVSVKELYTLEQYTLKFVAHKFLTATLNKKDLPGDMISPFLCCSNKHRDEVLLYCEYDVRVTLGVLVKLLVAGSAMEMAYASFTSIMQIMTQKAQCKIENTLVHRAYQRGFIFDELRRKRVQNLYNVPTDFFPKYAYSSFYNPRPDNQTDHQNQEGPRLFALPKQERDKYSGAIVLEPIRKIHDNPAVATVDYASLYPSVMMGMCLDYGTWVPHAYTPDGKLYLPGFKSEDVVFFTPFQPRPLPQHTDNHRKLLVLVFLEPGEGPKRKKMSTSLRGNPHGLSTTTSSASKGGGAVRTMCFVQNRYSLLPEILRDFVSFRKAVKADMESAKLRGDKFEEKVLDARQAAIKVICNATYGFVGAQLFAKRAFAPIAHATTGLSRINLLRTKVRAEAPMLFIITRIQFWEHNTLQTAASSSFPSSPSHESKDSKDTREIKNKNSIFENAPKLEKPSLKAAYGDTDSLFLILPPRNPGEPLIDYLLRCKKGALDFCALCNDGVMLPDPMKLEYEKVFLVIAFLDPKMYFGMKLDEKAWDDLKDKPEEQAKIRANDTLVPKEFYSKGTREKKRDTTPVARDYIKVLLKRIVSGEVREKNQAPEYKYLLDPVIERLEEFCSPTLDVARLAKTIAKRDEYKQDHTAQENFFLRESRRTGMPVSTGSRLYFLVRMPMDEKGNVRFKTKTETNEFLWEELEYFKSNKSFRLNYESYLETQFEKPLKSYLCKPGLVPEYVIDALIRKYKNRCFAAVTGTKTLSSSFFAPSKKI